MTMTQNTSTLISTFWRFLLQKVYVEYYCLAISSVCMNCVCNERLFPLQLPGYPEY